MEKKEIKLSLFADGMVDYVENLKKCTKNPQTYNLHMSSGTMQDKRSNEKNQLHFYIPTRAYENENWKYDTTYNCQKNEIGVNLTKYVQDLYTENYTMLKGKPIKKI